MKLTMVVNERARSASFREVCVLAAGETYSLEFVFRGEAPDVSGLSAVLRRDGPSGDAVAVSGSLSVKENHANVLLATMSLATSEIDSWRLEEVAAAESAESTSSKAVGVSKTDAGVFDGWFELARSTDAGDVYLAFRVPVLLRVQTSPSSMSSLVPEELSSFERTSNRASDLDSADDSTYPTTLAVKTAVAAENAAMLAAVESERTAREQADAAMQSNVDAEASARESADSALSDRIAAVEAGGSGGSGTTDYNDLENKPAINGVELAGDKTASDLGITPLSIGALAANGTADSAQKVTHSLTAGGKSFDGSKDVEITAEDVGALAEDGTAVAAFMLVEHRPVEGDHGAELGLTRGTGGTAIASINDGKTSKTLAMKDDIPALDSTLTSETAAAQAKAVGDALDAKADGNANTVFSSASGVTIIRSGGAFYFGNKDDSATAWLMPDGCAVQTEKTVAKILAYYAPLASPALTGKPTINGTNAATISDTRYLLVTDKSAIAANTVADIHLDEDTTFTVTPPTIDGTNLVRDWVINLWTEADVTVSYATSITVGEETKPIKWLKPKDMDITSVTANTPVTIYCTQRGTYTDTDGTEYIVFEASLQELELLDQTTTTSEEE